MDECLDEFFDLYFKMNMSKDIDKSDMMIRLKELADSIPSLKGWPDDKTKFWDVESYFWSMRFNKVDREHIIEKINQYISENHLDIASGALPVNSDCVCMDLSKEMLDMIGTDQKKVLFDIDSKNRFPFDDSSFDSISCIFILNYIENLDHVLSEIYRILKDSGKLIIVQSKKPLHALHRQKEKYNPDHFEDILIGLLEENNFFVEINNDSFNGNEYMMFLCSK